MQAPLILGNAVYFVCQTAPLHYDLVALQANTGKLIWRDSFSGEVDLDLCACQQTLYVQLGDQIIAEDAANGQQIWQQDIPWNKGQLNYAMIEPPMVSAGAGQVYLVDWLPSTDFEYMPALLGAFSENTGGLTWRRRITQTW